MMHEVFGHGRLSAIGNTMSEQHTESIKFENMILRVMGHKNIQRTEEDHGTNNKTAISDPSKRPSYE